jgi:hypothetical protein
MVENQASLTHSLEKDPEKVLFQHINEIVVGNASGHNQWAAWIKDEEISEAKEGTDIAKMPIYMLQISVAVVRAW